MLLDTDVRCICPELKTFRLMLIAALRTTFGEKVKLPGHVHLNEISIFFSKTTTWCSISE